MDITITVTQAQIDLLTPLIEIPEEGDPMTIEEFVQDLARLALADRARGGAGAATAMVNAYNNAMIPVNSAFGTNYEYV